MNTPSAKMSVLVGEQFACLKVVGRANFSSAVDFKTVLTELWKRGYRYFVLDLSDCVLMDSTFLGMLAGFGIKVNPPQKEAERAIELLNPNPRITELLESLGVLELFRITHGKAGSPTCTEQYDHTPVPACKADLVAACVEAHETLMQINPENRSKFVDVNLFLTNELKNLKAPRC